MSSTKDVRVYGNQYGTWIEVSGNLLLKVCLALRIDITNMSLEDHDAIKDFLTKAIEEKCRAVLPACGDPDCQHAPDGGNHPVVGGPSMVGP